jgi:hypothetical protein
VKVIKDFVIRGVPALPLKKISSQDLRKEESIRNDEGHIDRGETKILRPLEGGKNFLVPQATFPSQYG